MKNNFTNRGLLVGTLAQVAMGGLASLKLIPNNQNQQLTYLGTLVFASDPHSYSYFVHDPSSLKDRRWVLFHGTDRTGPSLHLKPGDLHPAFVSFSFLEGLTTARLGSGAATNGVGPM